MFIWKNFILHVVSIFALYVAYDFGLIQRMFQEDVTYITSFLLVIYTYFSGAIIYYAGQQYHTSHAIWERIHFWAESFLTMGMIGTVIGFLIAFSTSFVNFDVSDTSNLDAIISGMSVGVSSALWTTLIGLILNLMLKLQLMNAISELENEEF